MDYIIEIRLSTSGEDADLQPTEPDVRAIVNYIERTLLMQPIVFEITIREEA